MFSGKRVSEKVEGLKVESYSEQRQRRQQKLQGVIAYSEFSKANRPTICDSFCFDCPHDYEELQLTESTSVNRTMLTIDDKKLRINESNYRMLCALHNNAGIPLSREFLLEYVWGAKGKVANNVNVMVSELRSYLVNSGLEIVTIRGQGYQMLNKSKREYRL